MRCLSISRCPPSRNLGLRTSEPSSFRLIVNSNIENMIFGSFSVSSLKTNLKILLLRIQSSSLSLSSVKIGESPTCGVFVQKLGVGLKMDYLEVAMK